MKGLFANAFAPIIRRRRLFEKANRDFFKAMRSPPTSSGRRHRFKHIYDHQKSLSPSSILFSFQHNYLDFYKNVNDDIQKALFTSTSHACSYFHSNLDGSSDPYDKYRGVGFNDISPELWELLQKENVRTEEYIDPLLQQTLLNELYNNAASSIENEDAESSLEFGPTGRWVYQFIVEENSGRRIYQRRLVDDGNSNVHDNQQRQEMVLEFADDADIIALSLSVDESYIACLFTRNNTDERQKRHVVIFRCIETNQQAVLQVPNSIISLEFGPIREKDNENHDHSIYLVATDSDGRPDRVLLAYLDSSTANVSNPELIFQSDDPAVFVDVQRTKGCRYVAIKAMTKLTNEIYLCSHSGNACGIETEALHKHQLRLVLPKQEDLVGPYHIDVGDDDDVVIMLSPYSSTGDRAGGDNEYRIIETSVDNLPLDDDDVRRMLQARKEDDKMNGSTLDEENGEIKNSYAITDMDIFQNHLVLYERSMVTGKPRIRVQSRIYASSSDDRSLLPPRKKDQIVPIEDVLDCGHLTPCGNMNYYSKLLRFQLESPVHMGSTYEYEFESHQLSKIGGIVGSNNHNNVEAEQERIFVTSSDGTQVPLSLVFSDNDDSHFDETRPVVLVGYGAYGESINLGFDPSWVSLFRRGYVLAFAHTRGGSDLGNAWYDAGRRENKIKAIEDFEACAAYLKKRWKGGNLIAKAFSAGGVIVGAAVNRNPDLFDKVVLTNAFLDVYKTMKDPKLFLTIHEWDEYGNLLQDLNIAKLVQSYCPVSNLSSKTSPSTSPFPDVLVIGTLDDENVPYRNSVIYALKCRNVVGADNIYLHVEESGQHHLGARRLPVSAMELSFIIGS